MCGGPYPPCRAAGGYSQVINTPPPSCVRAVFQLGELCYSCVSCYSFRAELCYVCYSFWEEQCYVLQVLGPVTLSGVDSPPPPSLSLPPPSPSPPLPSPSPRRHGLRHPLPGRRRRRRRLRLRLCRRCPTRSVRLCRPRHPRYCRGTRHLSLSLIVILDRASSRRFDRCAERHGFLVDFA